METENITSEVYSYIKKEMNNSNDFDLSTNVLDEGMVDSMAIMSLVTFLEQKYGVEIDFEEINPDNFATVGAITNLIKKLLE
jgi:acyl carrier protein